MSRLAGLGERPDTPLPNRHPISRTIPILSITSLIPIPNPNSSYFIPRAVDPGYHDGDGDGEHDDMMRDALCTKESYQHIRAIPLQQGEVGVT